MPLTEEISEYYAVYVTTISEKARRFTRNFRHFPLHKKVFTLALLLLAVAITVYLVQSFTLFLSRAAAAQLSFSPSSLSMPPNANPGVIVNSGSTQIAFARVDITFDTTKVNLSSEINVTGPLKAVIGKTTQATANSTGKITVVLALCNGIDIPCSPSPAAPSGTFELFKLPLTSVTGSTTSTSLAYDVSTMQLVDTAQANVTLTASNATINLNPASATNTTTPAITNSPPPPGSAIRIETGSTSDFTDSNGNIWKADSGFTGGTTIDRGSIAIANTAEDRIYQTERFSMSSYRIPVTNGSYDVKLHFAETSPAITSAGQRVFSVNTEGSLLTNLDVYSESGGKNIALVKTHRVNITDGAVDITFTRNIENPEINAIEVIPVVISTATPTASPQPTVAPATTLSLSTTNTVNYVNSTTPVKVIMNTNGNKVVGVELTVNFDPAKLQALDITPGTLMPGADTTNKVIDNTNGKVGMVILVKPGGTPVTGTGTLADISFKAKAAGTTPLSFASSTQVGALNVDVSALKSTTGLTLTIAASIPGDINQDGSVDIVDYVILFANFGKLVTDQGADPRADLVPDGKINILDYTILYENFGRTI